MEQRGQQLQASVLMHVAAKKYHPHRPILARLEYTSSGQRHAWVPGHSNAEKTGAAKQGRWILDQT